MEMNEIKRVEVVFFSGTGGTKRIAEAFISELKRRGKTVTLKNLGAGRMTESKGEMIQSEWVVQSAESAQSSPGNGSAEPELYLVVYPVYAFDAPKPVYYWAETIAKEAAGKLAAVISVSGGGEVWPNTGCRFNFCRRLEEKGLRVIYDNMMCMPANMMAEVSDHLAMQLIRAIPEKVDHTLNDIFSGRVKRTRHRKSPLRNYLTNLENQNSGRFAQELELAEDCKGCGWCARNCPMENIAISEQTRKPVFSDHCTICMRCVYGCPQHALHSKSSMVFKKGFDLDALERRMEGVALEPVEKCCKGIAFIGVKNYLLGKY